VKEVDYNQNSEHYTPSIAGRGVFLPAPKVEMTPNRAFISTVNKDPIKRHIIIISFVYPVL
jgi:hypothetical protein